MIVFIIAELANKLGVSRQAADQRLKTLRDKAQLIENGVDTRIYEIVEKKYNGNQFVVSREEYTEIYKYAASARNNAHIIVNRVLKNYERYMKAGLPIEEMVELEDATCTRKKNNARAQNKINIILQKPL
ncbi:hypothetical protein [Butyrivibrio proteoclasticus]|uniref:hypothetical protein n=1 Tax=Butyrivibrio proteoclasticus TaxID=43305 RepID=UPI0005AA29C2|nr:hypothetical protein [Butyrivibrio proteoclasticus]